ncbi:MAG: tyrosine-type recombinase/integrase, partial [Thermodesulfovibrionales bacterium]|nr:tyrosine-type recombinase/integrase [Thermodesulfovibrionales bacterium]
MKNPTCEIRLKANERSPKDTLSLEERNTLLSIPAKLLKDKGLLPEDKSASSFFLVRDACILHLFATTGIRLSEITSLKRSNVHLEDRTLTIRGKGSRS